VTAGIAAIVAAIDDLYGAVAAEPAACGDEMLAAWASDALGVLEAPADREVAREIRRAARAAARLARYWTHPDRAGARPADWRVAVDEALGSRGWRPAFAVARRGLEMAPSPDLFDEVRRRWRQVHFEPWPGPDDFAAWLEDRER
jgi:hypothetical protein